MRKAASADGCGLASRGVSLPRSRNVLVTGVLGRPGYSIALCDFGFSRVLTDLSASLAAAAATGGSRRGTPLWRAPELMGYGAKQPSVASDVYAFGVLAWEVRTRRFACHTGIHAHAPPPSEQVLTGMQPYAGAGLTDETSVSDIVRGAGLRPDTCTPSAAAALPSDTPPILRELMRACWEADPEHRPASMEAIRATLQQAQAATDGSTGGGRGILRGSLRLAPPPGSAAASQMRRGSVFAGGGGADAFARGLVLLLGSPAGIGRDFTRAAAAFRTAATEGSATAKSHLAALFAAGIGVKKDPAAARKLLLQALLAGDTYAEA